MKLQYLAIIFIIIIVPIILVTSYYIGLQIDTVTMQSSYNTKLITAAKEGIGAYEINTVQWNSIYSEIANSKRTDVMASINSFMDSLANKMGVGGANKKFIEMYIPAVAFTLYDGYYIYAPTYVQPVETEIDPITGDTGVAIFDSNKEPIRDGNQEYRHILRPFAKYSANYPNGAEDVTVNYTLDNYITVYGKFGKKAGYLIDTDEITSISYNSISNLKYDNTAIVGEQLAEQIAYRDSTNIENYTVKRFKYVYNTEGKKTYYDDSKGKFFVLSDKSVRNYLPTVSGVSDSCKYTKVSVLDSSTSGKSFTEYYRLLNPKSSASVKDWYKKNTATGTVAGVSSGPLGVSSNILTDYSSVNYYIEAYAFSKWADENLKNINVGGNWIFRDGNHPSSEAFGYESSPFTMHRQGVIEDTLRDNLNQAIVNYGEVNPGMFDFKMPRIEVNDWLQIQNNVSLIAFMQGIPIGNKYYNSYAVATSTNNTDFVNRSEIYFTSDGDPYYHRLYCERLALDGTVEQAYRGVEFLPIKTKMNMMDANYYPHDVLIPASNKNAEMACYHCLVDASNYEEEVNNTERNKQRKIYYNALGRERYVQRKTFGINS